MNNRIDARLDALVAELERRRLLQTAPLDPLSASLYEVGRELAGLDEQSRDALFEEWNAPDADGTCIPMTREQFDRFISGYSRP